MALTIGVVLMAALQAAVAVQPKRLEVRRACADPQGASFPDFVHQHNRSYKNDQVEYARRAKLFEMRAAMVSRHNCAPKRPLWMARVNHFGDWTDAELLALRGGRLRAWEKGGSSASALIMGKKLPDTISYANLSTIQKPQDQGRCGSCWAFAATTAMQARAELHGLPRKLSVGQVVACAPNPNECGGSGGCGGATTELAYEYAMQTGLVHESRMRYHKESSVQPHCPKKLRMSDGLAKHSTVSDPDAGYEEHSKAGLATSPHRVSRMGMTSWMKLPVNREEPIILALLESGPLTVSVAASDLWHYYDSGIMTPSDCDQDNLISHAVVLFGIGIDMWPDGSTFKYWHLKNSWGEWWGETGNMRLQRLDAEEKLCGWDERPEIGNGCKGGPNKVWVCGSCGILYNAAMPIFGTKVH